MLAATLEDVSALQYPVLASPKYDGIRCVIRDGRALTRSLKPIPNVHMREVLEAMGARAWGFDGEIMLPYPATFQAVESAVMSREKPPPADWFYAVFDWCPAAVDKVPFCDRLESVGRLIAACKFGQHVRFCEHTVIANEAMLASYEKDALTAGHEGVMLRALDAPYKFGRATAREGWLLKLKRMVDAEAEIVGSLELQHNRNEAFTGELGQTKRRTLKSGKVDGGMLGKLVVRDLKTGIEFKIGTGFTLAQRKLWWRIRDALIGRVVRYRFQEHGVKDKPRIASFSGFRDRRDLDGD
jgi:DNA ligase-1